MNNLNEKRAEFIINSAKNKVIAVIGDVMLDRYFWGTVSRISPEAPVPVIDVENETIHLGGAANVAQNLKSLNLQAVLCGVIGNDNTGRSFIETAESSGIDISGLFIDSKRPTTIKTRIIGNNQQIARIDREVRDDISKDGLDSIINCLSNYRNLNGIIIEDYNKGTVTKMLVESVIDFAKRNNVPVYVDPKKDNFFIFNDVDVFKPNRKEAQQALGYNLKNENDIRKAGEILLDKLQCKNVLITLGAEGMMLFENNGTISSVPTKARHIADVSGAGDTAIATLAASIAGGANIREASAIANFASGLVCEKPGIVSITPNELLESIRINI